MFAAEKAHILMKYSKGEIEIEKERGHLRALPLRNGEVSRNGVTRDRILDAAEVLIQRGDLSTLTCKSLAEAVGIRAPSLYKHFSGMDAVRDALALRGLGALTDLAKNAICGRSGREALEALAESHRAYAQAHPHLYAIAAQGPSMRSTAHAKLREDHAAVELAALRAYGIAPEEAARLAWCVRAAIRGFVNLELVERGAEPHEIDQSFDHLVDILDAGARSAAGRPTVELRFSNQND